MKYEHINEIIKKHGIVAQSMIAMEECSELIQAISKCVRSKEVIPTETREHLVEEMADVLICLEQLQAMYYITNEELSEWMNKKEERLLKREGLSNEEK